MSDVRSYSGRDMVGAVTDAILDNPIPAALVGMGLIWLLAGGARPTAAGLGMAVNGVSNLGARAAEGAKSVSDSVVGATASAADSVRNAASVGNIRATLSDLLDDQPLLLGAIVLAIGAGVAASLPTTQFEADYVGDASAEFQSKARIFAAEQAKEASNAARAVKSAIADEARAQGLTPDGLKAQASEIQQKVADLADYAGGAVREKLM